MLPSSHRQNYQEFKALLNRLQQTIVSSQQDKSVHELAATVYQFFQQQILIDTSELESADAARVQSYQTEMSKQLQMMRMDLMFLQVARQPETATARQLQLGDRLQTLIGYCNALL